MTIPFTYKVRFVLRFYLEHFLGKLFPQHLFDNSNKKYQRDLFDYLRTQKEYLFEPVPMVTDLSKADFERDYFLKGRPVVLKSAGKHWTAINKWDFDFIKEQYGSDEALIIHHKFYEEGSTENAVEVTTLKEVIESLDATEKIKYARFHPLLDRHPELREDLDFNWINHMMCKNTNSKWNFNALFIGKKGSKTPIHNAGNENLFVQIKGRKRWLLWDPGSIYVLNPEVNRGPAKNSTVNPNNPDLNAFPAFKHIPTYEAILEPGDILYVPAYMWHHVENLDNSIGVATRWTSVPNSFKRSPILFPLEFFNTNPLIYKTMLGEGEFDFNKILAMHIKK